MLRAFFILGTAADEMVISENLVCRGTNKLLLLKSK